MKDQELTPWFVNGEKPVRAGVYNVSCKREGQSGNWWCKFDGDRWVVNWRWDKGQAAAEHVVGNHKPASWRGLASDPKANP